jgi:hypothetical protein
VFETNIVVRDISISEYNVVMVLRIKQVIEDGVVIAETYIRSSIAPGEDYSQEDSRVRDICKLLHTPEAIAAYQALLHPSSPNS